MSPVTLLRTVPLMNIDAGALTQRLDEQGLGRARASVASSMGFIPMADMLARYPTTIHVVRVGVSDEVVIHENTYLGVRTGDLLFVDRTTQPVAGRLVLAVNGSEIGLCRYIEHDGGRFLVSGVRGEEPIKVMPDHGVHVWGVVLALCRAV